MGPLTWTRRPGHYKVKDTRFIDKKTKADIFTATKCLNCTLALISLNAGNLIVIFHNLVEICDKQSSRNLNSTKSLFS